MLTLYVDKETGQIASDKPREIKTRSELFDLGRFDSLEDAIDEASLCDPLRILLEQLDDDLWFDLEQDTTRERADRSRILSEREDFVEPVDILKTLAVVGNKQGVLSMINSWLEDGPDAEDWDYGSNIGNPFLGAFRLLSSNGIPDGLNIDLVEGFYPGDNTQVAVLRMSPEQANGLSSETNIRFVVL
ncbi:hypothetical protein [Ruegeria arenilitoris]|uniref:hypothetical protein n=1 Tax=Ruegeria arenilitoris TaxID=1173585 RepID=UPI001479DE88|nr:hypothetical protein [Ruegeria arenilitoris]